MSNPNRNNSNSSNAAALVAGLSFGFVAFLYVAMPPRKRRYKNAARVKDPKGGRKMLFLVPAGNA